MSTKPNSLFRMVSLRAPTPIHTVPVSDESSGLAAILADYNPVPVVELAEQPKTEIKKILEGTPPITKKDLDDLYVKTVAEAFNKAVTQLKTTRPVTCSDLRKLKLELPDRTNPGVMQSSPLPLAANDRQLRADLQTLADTWIAIQLGKDLKIKWVNEPASIDDIESLLRSGRILRRCIEDPSSLTLPGSLEALNRTRYVYPERWRASKRLRARQKLINDSPAPREPLKLARERRKKLLSQIAVMKHVRRKALLLYKARIQEELDQHRATNPDLTPPAVGGVVRRAAAYLFGSPADNTARLPAGPIIAQRTDDAFVAELLTFTEAQKSTYYSIDETLRGQIKVGIAYEDLGLTIAHVVDELSDAANVSCSEIHVWEEEAKKPDTDRQPPKIDENNRPSVRAIGFGDLVVARDRLIGYEANEVAHIENVLPGEDRLREHEETSKREVVTESEVEEESIAQNELGTTDRYELEIESEKVINTEMHIEAGVNASGKYGVTTVQASLEAGLSSSTEQSHSTTSKLARDIVSRAVHETHKRARELRRVTVTEQIRELNRHRINREFEKAPFSGVYYWVEKIHEVELRHYGTRLMLEFFVPEPALSLLPENNQTTQDLRKPAPLTIGPENIDETNYRCLAERFGALDVQPPPAEEIQVGYTWASTPVPDPAGHGEEREDVKADTMKIPDGYLPVFAWISTTGQTHADWVDTFVSIAGSIYYTYPLAGQGTTYAMGPLKLTEPLYAPEGLPITIRVAGARNKAAVVNVRIDCERTTASLHAWQLRTFERIREAHALLVSDYERKVARAEMQGGLEITGRPAAQNREREIEELKKWAIKTMRLSPFSYDAVVRELEREEIDPVWADAHAPVVRFFEDAFEWRQMTFLLYPYYWGRRNSYGYRSGLMDPDALHQAFLRAGAARVIVPVTPGYEPRLLHYLDTQTSIQSELERVTWIPARPSEDPTATIELPQNSEAQDVWLEVLINRNDDVQRGTGTLGVTKHSDIVIINIDDSNWKPDERDIGRELFINGDVYTITEILSSTDSDRRVKIDPKYRLADASRAIYGAGSVRIGEPWQVRLPTALVILAEEKAKLFANIEGKEKVPADA